MPCWKAGSVLTVDNKGGLGNRGGADWLEGTVLGRFPQVICPLVLKVQVNGVDPVVLVIYNTTLKRQMGMVTRLKQELDSIKSMQNQGWKRRLIGQYTLCKSQLPTCRLKPGFTQGQLTSLCHGSMSQVSGIAEAGVLSKCLSRETPRARNLGVYRVCNTSRTCLVVSEGTPELNPPPPLLSNPRYLQVATLRAIRHGDFYESLIDFQFIVPSSDSGKVKQLPLHTHGNTLVLELLYMQDQWREDSGCNPSQMCTIKSAKI